MKTKVALILAALLGGIGSQAVSDAQRTYEMPPPEEIPQPAYAPPPLECSEADSYQYFYGPLRHYGEWVVVGSYGYCWRPSRVRYGWRPYWDGHWVSTTCGWTWVSEEPWGWACYHYGRWVLTAECGWVWVPGRVWAPAWVCWRHGPQFVAWAPLPPGVAIGVSIGDFAFGFDFAWWTCVPCRSFLASRCSLVALSADRCRQVLPSVTTVVNVTTVNNIIVNPGPSRAQIQAATGRAVPMLALRSAAASATTSSQTRISGGALIAATPTAALRTVPADPARIPLVESVTVARTATDARRAVRAQSARIAATPARTATPQTVSRPATSGESPPSASPAQPGTVRAQPAYPERRVWQKPEKIKSPDTTPRTTTPYTTPAQPAPVRALPAQPERTVPATRVPQSTPAAPLREGYPKERFQPARQTPAPAVSSPPASGRPEPSRIVEPRHAAPAPSVVRPAVHPPPAPPPPSRGEEKGQSKEKP